MFGILADISGMAGSPRIVSLKDGVRLVREAQQRGETVVLCHGCFDIVHPGHVRHLQHAAQHGDKLIVTITSDAHVGKGANRPLIPQELRAENLAALGCVDWVCANNYATAAELLDEIRPDVYVKGREYEHNRDPRFEIEKQIVQRYGGRVIFSSGDVIFSSTALIAALEDAANPFQASLRHLLDEHDITSAKVDTLIDSFVGQRVLVVGEPIIDTYVMCDRPDVATEGPIMTLRPIEYRSFDGGAAIIARHLAACGARPVLISAAPPGAQAEVVRHRLTLEGVEVHFVDASGGLPEKQRFLVGTQKVMKLDVGGTISCDAQQRRRLMSRALEAASGCNAAVIADFGLGLFTTSMLGELCTSLRELVDVLVGDVSGRRSNLLAMRGLDVMCPSESEIRDALHEHNEGLSSVAWRAMHDTNSRSAVVTLGGDGLIAFRTEDNKPPGGPWSSRLRADHVPALVPFAVDQLGCGDALLATLTLALAAGAELPTAALVGAVAAAAEAQRLGNAVIGASDLRRGVRRLFGAQLTYHAEPLSHARFSSLGQPAAAHAQPA
jgi:rfaE bifunctional protein nucleotidyltransferase chain/domain